MKFINQNNLYFRLGDIAPSGTTPTNDTFAYTLKVINGYDGTTQMKSYTGQIFFYSLDQKIYYDFLVDMALTDFDLTVNPQKKEFVPIVNVTFADSNNTITAMTQVSRTVITDDMVQSTVENYILPTGGTVCLVNPSYFGCDMPQYLINQYYPQLLYTGSFQPQGGEIIQCGCEQQYNIVKENTIYNFPMGSFDSDKIAVEIPTVTGTEPMYELRQYCDAPYTLIWYDPQGFFQSQPFYGSEKDNYTHNSLTNLNGYEGKYETQEKRTWSLKSELVTNQKTYRSLFTSPVIWLYVGETGKYHRVLVTDTNWSESRSKKAFRFSVTVNNNISTIYK